MMSGARGQQLGYMRLGLLLINLTLISDTMTTATPINETFNCGGSPIVSDIQPIIIRMGDTAVCRRM